jgi:DNA-binding transcriptional ArsR family regulator
MANTNTINDTDCRQLARKLSIASDPTRLKILQLMLDWQKGCVSSIADSTDISVATASYHLNHMADNDYFTRERDGQSVCYHLNDNKYVACLRKLLKSEL